MDTREARWKNDKFCAMRDIFQAANDRWRSLLQPDAYLTLDETLAGCRTQTGLRRYIPNKPDKYGILWKSLNAVLFPYTYLKPIDSVFVLAKI